MLNYCETEREKYKPPIKENYWLIDIANLLFGFDCVMHSLLQVCQDLPLGTFPLRGSIR